MKIKKEIWLLLIVVAIAAVLRLWKLGSIPPSLTQDEVSLGYNAYSILKTGRDEYGKFMPFIFKSFGDFKPGLYVYATVPFVWLLGLNEWAVRLPSALAGVFSVYLIYLIVLQFSQKRQKLGLFAAFLVAVNPWLIYFSRGAWEANLSLMLTLLGVYFFLKSRTEKINLIYSSITFALTFLTYQGAKLSTFIVLSIAAYVYWTDCKKLFKNEVKVLLLSSFLGLLIISPVIFSFFKGQTGRLSVFSVFSYPRPPEYTNAFLAEGGESFGDLNYYLFHSEALNFVRGIMGRWYNHFSGKFLFFAGDYQNPMHSAPNSGMLLLVDLILIPAGAYFLLHKGGKEGKKGDLFMFLWLVLAPLPAVLSRDQVQSVRALNMAIPLVYFSSIGLKGVTNWMISRKHAIFFYSSFAALFLLSLIYFVDSYFVHFPIHNAKYWLYGYKQAVQKISPIQNDYDKIIFQQSYNQPYIFFLFYQKYDPKNYQRQADLTSGGSDVGLVNRLGNIEFESYSWPPAIDPKQKTLVVGDSVAIPPDFSTKDYKLVGEIKYPDNFITAFRIIEPR